MQDRRIVPANQRVEVVNSSNNNVENNFEDKLQKVLNLYKEEKASVQNLQQSIANKRKQLQLLQDTTENMERNIFHKEEILYSIRLNFTKINERVNAFVEQEQVMKARQFEIFSAIQIGEETCEKIEKSIKEEKLHYIRKLREVNQNIFLQLKQKYLHDMGVNVICDEESAN